MKRIILLFSLILCLGTAKAQFLEIVVYTEPQITWITSDEARVLSDGSSLNLNTGIEFDMFFMPNYAFTAGINMNNQGGKLNYTEDVSFEQGNGYLNITAPASLKHNLQYIGVPLGLKLKSEEMGYMTFFIHGGLSPMFNINASTSSEYPDIPKQSIKKEVHVFNFNYFFEGGFEYRLAGNTALICGLKWSAGFTDVTANDLTNNNLNSTGLHLGILF